MWHPPSESMLLRAVGGMTDTLHRPSGHLVSKDSLHAVCTWKESHGRKGPRLARTPAGRPGRGEAAALAHHGLAPQAAPVLQAQHAAAGLVARRALGAHGQVSLQPLVRHGDLGTERRHTLGTSHTGGGKAGSARRCPPTAPARAWQRLAWTPEHGGPLQAGRKRTERGAGGRVSGPGASGPSAPTPSSSSMMSFPMEASVVHLQLLVARTAHRLWALNLHTVRE